MSSPVDTPSRTLVAFATRWGSQLGGINSFNTDLLSALAPEGHPHIRVVCIVLHASPEEISQARRSQVTIISLNREHDPIFNEGFQDQVIEALHRDGITPDPETVFLGHDRITGGIALACASLAKGRAALIHHMSYRDYEAFAENAHVSQQKEQEQRGLFQKAEILLAVGPVLRDALTDLLGKKCKIEMLVPGLPNITAVPVPVTFSGFLSGRISDDTRRIKQAQLGIAGFSDAIRRAHNDTGLPVTLTSSPILSRNNSVGATFQGSISGCLSNCIAVRKWAEEFVPYPHPPLPV